MKNNTPRGLRAALAGLAAACAALISGAAYAEAPAPKKPLAIERFLGRWHEIARTPNANQRGCVSGTSDWSQSEPGRFQVVQTCKRANGRDTVRRASATVVEGSGNAKLNLNFLGVIRQEYWVIDRADDYSWAIAGTPGGNYVWLLSRKPTLTPAERAALVRRIAALGYDTGKLEFAR